jgi:predicted transcriptional regulator
MARPSRSNKKQPAFDPSELEDLIFSPAVGKGVGSHLVGAPNLTTVVTSSPSLTDDPEIGLSTVVNSALATVDMSELLPDSTTEALEPPKRSPNAHLTTLAISGAAESPPSPGTPPAQCSSSQHKLWITENGDLVAEARVRKIRLAQDVINSAEESVYDTLWNAHLLQTDEREACRIVQAGYDYLVRRTRLARKTIQRIVAKLIEKDFIAVETRADIYQRTATVYRVFSYKAVLDKHVKKGRLHVAKMGPGFSYARPLERTPELDAVQPKESTVVRSDVTPIVKSDMTTVVNETTVTVVKIDRPTVVKMSPYLLDTSVLDISSSSAVRQELAAHGPVDDDALHMLISRCREQAPDCTAEEIIHFIREKSALIQKKKGAVYNPLGFLVTAVPRCFAPDTIRAYREQISRQREGEAQSELREQAAMERWRREQEASLSDPKVSEQEKHLIRLCLGLNTS